MSHDTHIEYKVNGRFALFTDPITKLGGEKYSYPIPTHESMVGITNSIYWKPTLDWHIEQIRVINKIQTQTMGIKRIKTHSYEPELSIYCYLINVEYQVAAHFEWNLNRINMAQDRDELKHTAVAERCINKGGRRDIFLGTRECQGYVEPCAFGSGPGYYDNYDEISFGLMFHGFSYPDQIGKNELHKRLWRPKMERGIIKFIRPEECISEFVRKMQPKVFENKTST